MSAVISASNMSLYAALRHMEAQNQAVREAWESERKYLEANRARAEEVYMEERSIMDEAVNLMETERDQLLDQVYRLRKNVRDLENENDVLRQKLGIPSSIPENQDDRPLGLRGGAGSSESVLFSTSESIADDNSPEASRPVAQISPRTNLSLLSPVPLQGPVARMDFLATNRSLVPTIDIQEIHPELEGIPIKETAIKSPTFVDLEPPVSLPTEASIQPLLLERPVEAGSHTDTDLDGDIDADTETSTLKSPPSELDISLHGDLPNEEALEMLNVHESVRLKIHAGHTPNHSLSKFPSFSAATTSTTQTHTATAQTPTHIYGAPAALGNPTVFDVSHIYHSTSGAPEETTTEGSRESIENQQDGHRQSNCCAPFPAPHANSAASHGATGIDENSAHISQGPVLATTHRAIAQAEDFDSTLTPPEHDKPLKGPLMITNIPAKDEIFLAKLAEKLEAVKISREASPESLTHSEKDEESQFPPPPLPVDEAKHDSTMPQGHQTPQMNVQGGGNGNTSKRPRTVAELVDDEEDDEPDIPLRFKKTTNFGLPMGQFC
ncbi:hypothetical protein BROUX41_002386 [Berkeleyomyces rouxiae]|uniref:uncharacterized protein n=1 Tax=Berkeleyomyces rouxiae TaxID=2035830 RepID=UPI003B807426